MVVDGRANGADAWTWAREGAPTGASIQPLVHRGVQLVGAAAGEVASPRAVVRHEQRIAREHRVAHDVAHARRRVAGRVQGSDREAARTQDLVAFGESVELRAVDAERGVEPEDGLERALHGPYPLADHHGRTQLALEELRRREVVGVRVGLEQQVHAQPVLTDPGEQCLGRRGRRLRTLGVVVERAAGR